MGLGDARLKFALALLCLTVSACLVTDKPVFGEPNTPTSVLAKAPRTLTRAPLFADQLCESADKRFMAFEVEISDANVSDKLIARLLVNGDYEVERPIPANGQISRGTLRLCARKGELTKTCNHVELVVTNSFGGPGKYEVLDPTDIGKAEW